MAFHLNVWNDLAFSPNGRFLGVPNDGIYEVSTGNKVISFNEFETYTGGIFSPDSTLYFTHNGIFDLQNIEQHDFEFPDGYFTFSPDGTILSVTFEQYFNLNEDAGSSSRIRACLIYSIKDNQLPWRAGYVRANTLVDVWDSPNGEVITNGKGDFAVFAVSEDKEWYAVFIPSQTENGINIYTWIAADDVEIISLPNDIPNEVPDIFNMDLLNN